MMPDLDRRTLVYIAVFGTFWGLVEASLGTILHALRIPLSGSIVSATGLVILLVARCYNNVRGSSVLMALIAGAIKMIGFSTIKLGPFIGIVMEGVIVEVILSTMGVGLAGFILSGIMVGIYPLIQNIITKSILFGASFVPVILETAEGFSQAVGLPLGWWLLIVYVLIHLFFGLLGALLAWLLRNRIKTALETD